VKEKQSVNTSPEKIRAQEGEPDMKRLYAWGGDAICGSYVEKNYRLEKETF